MFYHEFGAIMMRAPVIGLEFTRYLPLALVPFVLLQVRFWSYADFQLCLGNCVLKNLHLSITVIKSI